jgi:hypothetical protein
VQLLLAHPDVRVNQADTYGRTPLTMSMSGSSDGHASHQSPLCCLVLLLASRRVPSKVIEETVRYLKQLRFHPQRGPDVRQALSVLKAELAGTRRWCAYCYAVKLDGKTFSVCARCQQVGYCSPEHQKAHWKATHKHQCPATPL